MCDRLGIAKAVFAVNARISIEPNICIQHVYLVSTTHPDFDCGESLKDGFSVVVFSNQLVERGLLLGQSGILTSEKKHWRSWASGPRLWYTALVGAQSRYTANPLAFPNGETRIL
jgi:hypothetical protein